MLRSLQRLYRRALTSTGTALLRVGGSRIDNHLAYLVGRAPAYYDTRVVPLGDDTALALLHGRILIYVDTRGADLAPHVMMFGIWEPSYTQLFQRLIRPGDTVLDIGAHHGVYTLIGAFATGAGGRLHAFEPNPRFAGLLRRSIAANGLGGIATLHEAAVGAEAAETELRWQWDYGGGGHLAIAGRRGNPALERSPVQVVALDEVFPDPAFTVDVIKMDVEGTETFAVRGMRALLARSPRVRLMLEFAPQMLAGHGGPAPELVQELGALGFRFWSIGDNAALAPIAPEALAAETTGIRNILAARGDPFAA